MLLNRASRGYPCQTQVAGSRESGLEPLVVTG